MRRMPPGLGAQGKWLWREVTTMKRDMTPGDLLLLEKACRITDNIERIEWCLKGETFAYLAPVVEGETEYKLIVNSALTEHRLQVNTLRACLTSLGLFAGEAAEKPPATKGGDPVDDLGERRRARRAANPTGL